jgi:hypothetical protein
MCLFTYYFYFKKLGPDDDKGTGIYDLITSNPQA